MFKFRFVVLFLAGFLSAFNAVSSQPTISDNHQCLNLADAEGECRDRLVEMEIEKAQLKMSLETKQCRTDHPTRLIDPNNTKSNPAAGRLEINYEGTWGTVCGNSFTATDAKVACAALGFGYVGKVVDNIFGIGVGPIWLVYVKCNGSEQNIGSCDHNPWGVHNCQHSEDIAISCGYPVRLVNPNSTSSHLSEGRLEIFFNETWGTVCDDDFTTPDAIVACVTLGLGYAGTIVDNTFGTAIGPIWLDDVDCIGTELNFGNCHHRPWGIHNCGHSEDVAIRCGENQERQLLSRLHDLEKSSNRTTLSLQIERQTVQELRRQISSMEEARNSTEIVRPGEVMDPWTKTLTGCRCHWDPTRSDCACCRRLGCQCDRFNKNQCVMCRHPQYCGMKEDIFGPNQRCVPKRCPAN